MINPNGEDFTKKDPVTGSTYASGSQFSPDAPVAGNAGMTGRFQDTSERVSAMAGDAWRQTKETASTAREKTEFLMRENPIPTVIGALAVGLAIGFAIRYASDSREQERQVKSTLGDIDLSMLSLPFLWPFFKTVKRRYEDSADIVKDGVDRLKGVDVDSYVKPLRKKWRAW
nr:hypothetical protein [Verrucomicrobiota bacterium]